MSAPRGRSGAVVEVLADVGAVLVVWVAAAVLESLLLATVWGDEFTGAWEVTQVRRLLVPVGLVAGAPLAFALAGWWRVAEVASRGAGEGRAARVAMGLLGALSGALVAFGVTHGRHFTSLAARVAAVALVAAAGAAVAGRGLPRLARLGPGVQMALGAGLAAGAWMADLRVLPRLYPAFHQGTLVAALGGLAVVGLAARTSIGPSPAGRRAFALLAGLGLLFGVVRTGPSLRALARLSNLRRIVVDHAPLLGPVVELGASLEPPDEPSTPPGPGVSAPGEVARSLDWTGHDLVLVSVDALRADHVSAYGYARPTTPNLDALAKEGTLFEAAYCPTPHTSYSITSMMTGKYVRPLLALGLGADSDTWAEDLRLYGFRTAAFYPPAVFFIDQERFASFEQTHLGFEYAKVEFADPALREQQVGAYLAGAGPDKPLFLWVHFFEPHEPYVAHADHVFTGGPSADVDAYDGEVATADDGIGRIVRLVRARRPGAVVVVTADHGEEFGEHGGRYHGTTVYEEQVRVPLVIAGPGVRPGARVSTVVQTIDVLPTVLSALGIPRPARARGRDLGPLLVGQGDASPGFAFAETDDYDLVASGGDRLVCGRRAAACSLYEPASDPLERHDVGPAQPARFDFLRAALRQVERDHGRFEAAGGPAWPEALRRGMVGDVDAAVDVASLLDDADVTIRRKAAEVSFALQAPAALPSLGRALSRDEDEEVRRWAGLALVRLGEPVPPGVPALLKEADARWRRAAALALGGRADPRACEAIASWWEEVAPAAEVVTTDGEPPRLAGLDLPRTEELLEATRRARCRSAVPALVRALQDVRARPYVADALGALGDDRARAPLKALLGAESNVTTRPHEAEALLTLGARDWAPKAAPAALATATLKGVKGPARLVVLVSDPAARVSVTVGGHAVPAPTEGRVRDLPWQAGAGTVEVTVDASAGVVQALWVLPVAALD